VTRFGLCSPGLKGALRRAIDDAQALPPVVFQMSDAFFNLARVFGSRLLAPAALGRRINLSDRAKAIAFGVVRAGDERSTHFRAVPAGFDAKPERLFDVDVARR